MEEYDRLSDLLQVIEETLAEDIRAIKDGGLIRDGWTARWMRPENFRPTEKHGSFDTNLNRNLTGIGVSRFVTTGFGYYIEVSKANVHLVPAEYVRKQALVNAERTLRRSSKYEEKIQSAETVILEAFHFEPSRGPHGQRLPGIEHRSPNRTGCFQCPRGRRGKVLSSMNRSRALHPIGQHPVIEDLMGEGYFIPNDVQMDASHRNFLLITGPNMAGKSTVMRQVALIGLMAQVGSFVPASSATLGIIDRIFTRVGASDNLSRGQSTFMVEMTETANILAKATSRSLVILDEIGRGTSTFDGLSIAWAVVEHIHNSIRCRTLFATHYHELTS